MSEVVNLPDVDGVPAVNFAPGAEQGIELLDSDSALGLPNSASQWGVYRNFAPVVLADSVIDLSLKKEWSLSDAPQEKGAFETYDKVILPYDVRIRFSAGGSLANRTAFLASIEAIAGDLNLYDVVTPESVYTSVNVVHYDFKRTASAGLGLITVDIWLLQVRVVNGSQTSDATNPNSGTGTGETAAPSGADAVNGGTVQTTPATQAQTDAVVKGAVSGEEEGTIELGPLTQNPTPK